MPRKVTEIRRQLAKACVGAAGARPLGWERPAGGAAQTQTSPSGTDALTDAPAPLASPQMHPSRPCACARRPRGRRETVSLCAGVLPACRAFRTLVTTHEHEARNEHRSTTQIFAGIHVAPSAL